jgi:hypothetical protein
MESFADYLQFYNAQILYVHNNRGVCSLALTRVKSDDSLLFDLVYTEDTFLFPHIFIGFLRLTDQNYILNSEVVEAYSGERRRLLDILPLFFSDLPHFVGEKDC